MKASFILLLSLNYVFAAGEGVDLYFNDSFPFVGDAIEVHCDSSQVASMHELKQLRFESTETPSSRQYVITRDCNTAAVIETENTIGSRIKWNNVQEIYAPVMLFWKDLNSQDGGLFYTCTLVSCSTQSTYKSQQNSFQVITEPTVPTMVPLVDVSVFENSGTTLDWLCQGFAGLPGGQMDLISRVLSSQSDAIAVDTVLTSTFANTSGYASISYQVTNSFDRFHYYSYICSAFAIYKPAQNKFTERKVFVEYVSQAILFANSENSSAYLEKSGENEYVYTARSQEAYTIKCVADGYPSPQMTIVVSG